jgi:uncharacterized protein YjbI with pentapeptide repeats
MEFVAGMHPCEACGSWEPLRWQTIGSGSVWTVSGRCPRCSGERSYVFQGEASLNEVQPPTGELGGPEPSQLVDARALVLEVERLAADEDQVDRALTALVELTKFLPGAAPHVPGTEYEAGSERFTRMWIETELARTRALARLLAEREVRKAAVPPARGTIDRDALDAHIKWVRRGKMGEGRLDVVGFDGRARRLDSFDMSGARLEAVRLLRASLELTHLREAELVEIDFTQAQLGSIKLGGAVLRGCRFDGANLAIAELDRTHVTSCSFARVMMDRSTWRDALVEDSNLRHVQFGDTLLDGARFQRCDLRSVVLTPIHPRIVATSRGTVFEHCDFRGADFTGRDLAGAVFLACKLGGAHGQPATTEGWSVEQADLSPAGDGSQVGSAADVLALLR